MLVGTHEQLSCEVVSQSCCGDLLKRVGLTFAAVTVLIVFFLSITGADLTGSVRNFKSTHAGVGNAFDALLTEVNKRNAKAGTVLGLFEVNLHLTEDSTVFVTSDQVICGYVCL